MISKAYKDYLKSPRWQAKRQQVFAHYGKRCYACRKYAGVLHVHHLSYANLGNEPLRDLMPLCVQCHREVTKLSRRYRRRSTREVTIQFVKMKRQQPNR